MNFLDTSTVILFADYINHVSCIDHLHSMGNNLNISKIVHDEYYHETTLWLNNNTLRQYIDDEKIKIIKRDLTNTLEQLKRRHPNLHEGELSVIALGLFCQKNSNDYICVIDEKDARKVAKKLELNLTGSIGLIKLIKERNNWSENYLESVITDIKNSPFFISDAVLEVLRND